MNLHIAFKMQCPLWPALSRTTPIPDHLKSKHASSAPSNVGPGIVLAVLNLLRGQIQVVHDQANKSILIEYPSSKGGTNRAMLTYHSHPTYVDLNSGTGPFVGCLVETLLTNRPGEVLDRLTEFNRRLDQHSTSVVFTEGQIQQLAQDKVLTEQLMGLSDAIYFDLKERSSRRELLESSGVMFPARPSFSPLTRDWIPGRKSPRPVAAVSSTSQRLSRLLRRGGNALLVGPTGTFKTESVKQAALQENLRLVTIKGRPGLEDRDFFGGIYPGVNGPVWVDGPVTRAFRQAAEGKVVLLFDELTRAEAYYVNAFIGILDHVSNHELQAMNLGSRPDGRYYVLQVPNGDVVVAPKGNLNFIATTNLGDDYIQGGRIDAALMRRFDLTVEVNTPDVKVVQHLYRQTLSTVPDPTQGQLVKLALEFDDWSRKESTEADGVLERPSNPSVTMSWLKEALAIQQEGEGWESALVDAATVTVVPFCLPRVNGQTPADISVAMTDEVFRMASRLL